MDGIYGTTSAGNEDRMSTCGSLGVDDAYNLASGINTMVAQWTIK